MNHQPLRYFMHNGPAAFRIELDGDLNTEGALRLEKDWVLARSVIGKRALIVDLTFVTTAEGQGRGLLARLYIAGAQFVAQSEVSRELAKAVTGRPLPEFSPASIVRAGRTWLPFRTYQAGSA